MNTSQLHKAFDSLLPTEEQKETMICNILIDRDGAPQRRRRGNPVRLAVLAAAALALCVVTASAAEALGVSQMIRDYFAKKEEVNIMDSINLAASGLSTRTADGWEVTITDLFGDENRCLMGVTVEAPVGTILDRSDYTLRVTTNGTPCTLPANMMEDLDNTLSVSGYLQKEYWRADQVPDDNPRDNQVSFVFDEELIYYQDGITVSFTFCDLTWDEPSEDPMARDTEHVVKQLDAAIPDIVTHFATNGYHLSPNISIDALGGTVTLSKFELTPLSVSYELTGEIVKQQFFDVSDFVDTNPPYDQFLECLSRIQPTRADRHLSFWGEENFVCWRNTWFLDVPVVAHFKDGTTQELSFTGASLGNNTFTDADRGTNSISASYTFDDIFDLNQLDCVTVCDERITFPEALTYQ